MGEWCYQGYSMDLPDQLPADADMDLDQVGTGL